VLVARHAATLLGGAAAELSETVGGTSHTVATWVDHGATPGPRRTSASIAPEQREWGTLDVIGLPPTPLSGDREQLLHRLADLAGLAISGARARRRLEIEAMTDALTGLHNQRAFRRRLSDEISRAGRYERPLSLVLIDLDAFKAINDVDGHLTGDLVLAEVARRILAAVRVEGLVARLGGDEMAILLPECDAASAYSVAERVREAVSAAPIGTRDRVTISTGIAERGPDGREEDMISQADAALYSAKRMGGDQGAVFSPRIAADSALSPETLSSAPLPAGEARSA
jgi:diguanylate cyclase (GGDEF)-like protein